MFGKVFNTIPNPNRNFFLCGFRHSSQMNSRCQLGSLTHFMFYYMMIYYNIRIPESTFRHLKALESVRLLV
jgi:hypothetical protein